MTDYLLPNDYVTRDGICYTTVQSGRGFCIGSLSMFGGAFRDLLNPAFADFNTDHYSGERCARVDDCAIGGCGVAFAVSDCVPESDFPDGLVALVPLELFDAFDGKNPAALIPPERIFTIPGVARMGIESVDGSPVIAICLPDNSRYEFRVYNNSLTSRRIKLMFTTNGVDPTSTVKSNKGFIIGDPVYAMTADRFDRFFAAATADHGTVEIDGCVVAYAKTRSAQQYTAPRYDGDMSRIYTAVPGEVKNAPDGRWATDRTSGDWIPPILIEHDIIAVMPLELCEPDDDTSFCCYTCDAPGDAVMSIERAKCISISLPDGAELRFDA